MMVLEFSGFEWDDGNTSKIQNRFNIQEVEAFFYQELLIIEDKLHSKSEERLIATGTGPGNKPMFVCFTIRVDKIRVISARFMSLKEASKYEEFKKNFK